MSDRGIVLIRLTAWMGLAVIIAFSLLPVRAIHNLWQTATLVVLSAVFLRLTLWGESSRARRAVSGTMRCVGYLVVLEAMEQIAMSLKGSLSEQDVALQALILFTVLYAVPIMLLTILLQFVGPELAAGFEARGWLRRDPDAEG